MKKFPTVTNGWVDLEGNKMPKKEVKEMFERLGWDYEKSLLKG